jgi:hypothetical protein
MLQGIAESRSEPAEILANHCDRMRHEKGRKEAALVF